MTKTKRTILTILAIIGLALSIELCFVYYNVNFSVNSKPSICAINDIMDCDGVARTSYSQFMGVPLSLWGVILYIFFLFMTYVDKLKKIKFFPILNVFKNPTSYIFLIAAFSFTMSMILASISIFKINSICVFCFVTYFIDLLISICAKTKGISILDEIKICFSDFVDAIKVKKYALYFVLFMMLVISILIYTSVSNILSPQISKQIQMKKYFKMYKNQTNGNEMGPKDADVVVHEYMDFNCGGCFLANLYLHRIVSEFTNVKVVQHNVPLDKQCNHNMKTEGHKNSCLKARYAIAAAKQNLYWQMSDILFQQNVETEKDIIEESRLADFDIKKLKQDAHSSQIEQEIQESIKDADSRNVTGTPTIFIGMRTVLGVASYPEFKQIIIEQGGKERN